MSGRRERRPSSDTAESLMPLAADGTNSLPHSKILLLGAFAGLLMVVAVPILFGLPVAAHSSLKCYDSAGNYKSCLVQPSASRLNGRTSEADQPPSWTATALYHQESWQRALDQPASWRTSALEQPASSTISAPAERPTSTSEKRPALARCGRRLIPCFFSALGRGLTHIASVAANVGRARPAREHL